MNPFDIGVPCINIARSEMLFKRYTTDLNWDKYDIEVQNDDATKRNQVFFLFHATNVQSSGWIIYTLKYLLIDTIMKRQSRKQSAAEIEKLNHEKEGRKKEKKGHISLLQ